MGFSSGLGRKLAPPGDEPYGRGAWVGPTSYAQVVAGVPPSGGDPVSASLLGVNLITFIQFAASYTGNFMVIPIRLADNKWILKWVSLVTATVGGQAQTAFTEAVAATNLSAETVKLWIWTVSA
jgi:hypothetical protein